MFYAWAVALTRWEVFVVQVPVQGLQGAISHFVHLMTPFQSDIWHHFIAQIVRSTQYLSIDVPNLAIGLVQPELFTVQGTSPLCPKWPTEAINRAYDRLGGQLAGCPHIFKCVSSPGLQTVRTLLPASLSPNLCFDRILCVLGLSPFPATKSQFWPMFS